MTSPTNSSTKHRGPIFGITGRRRLFPRRHRRRKTAPRPTGPVFRKIWKEVAPGSWQLLHVYDERDKKK